MFTPNDAVDYSHVTQTTTISVGQATPTVSVTGGGVYDGGPIPATATVTGVNTVPAPSLEGVSPTLTYYAGPAPRDRRSVAPQPRRARTRWWPASPARRLHFRHGAGHFHDHSGHAVGDLERTRPNRLRHGAGAAQLDATANVQGSFAYSPAAGTVLGVGVHTLSVGFTPNDTVDYSSVTETTAITVTQSAFVKEDTTTEGNWIGTYGSQGYDIVGGPSSEPSYVTVTPEAESTCMWTSTSSQEQALEIPDSSNRLAACWFSSNVFTINVDFTDDNTHALALYALDYDDLGGPSRSRSRTRAQARCWTRVRFPISRTGFT